MEVHEGIPGDLPKKKEEGEGQGRRLSAVFSSRMQPRNVHPDWYFAFAHHVGSTTPGFGSDPAQQRWQCNLQTPLLRLRP